jgi:pectate lyase
VSSTGPSGAFGYGGAATGGAGGATVTVTTYADLVKYTSVYDPTPRIIKIQGVISGATGMVHVGANKTIIGLPGSALDGFGLDVNGWVPELAALNPAKAGAGCDTDVIGVDGLTPVKYPDGSVKAFPISKNVIIRNVTSRNSQDDGFDVACMSNTVWLDHNTIESPCDGYTDIKRGSDNVTVSWNHYKYTAGQNPNAKEFSGDSCEDDKAKTMLIGHETSTLAQTQSQGRLHVTVAHNWFDNTIQRHPRVRYGTVHVFNNYGVLSTDSQYFVGISNLATLYVENNSIINTDNPCKDFESASTSTITFVNNNVAGLKKSTAGQNLGCTTDAKLGGAAKPSYSYTLDALAAVPASVQQGAGAGVIVTP